MVLAQPCLARRWMRLSTRISRNLASLSCRTIRDIRHPTLEDKHILKYIEIWCLIKILSSANGHSSRIFAEHRFTMIYLLSNLSWTHVFLLRGYGCSLCCCYKGAVWAMGFHGHLLFRHCFRRTLTNNPSSVLQFNSKGSHFTPRKTRLCMIKRLVKINLR